MGQDPVITRAGDPGENRSSGTWEMRGRADGASRADSAEALAIVAVHEIGNVVGWVDMALAMLEREAIEPRSAGAGVQADVADTVRNARMGVRHIADIVHTLQTVARCSETALELFDPVEALRVAIRFAEARIRARAPLLQSLGPTPQVQGRRHELTCVFLNLLLNALEALPAQVQPTDAIRVVANTVDGNAQFEVYDTGVGIAPQAAERLFEPFFTGRPGSGMGLGLHVCHRIVGKMGGAITFDTEPGCGTRFVVTLPGCGG
ncbi:MAG: HAMP domain-containing histidine kinase [Deltaproteobacteria bacterium]|nr:HAMP domain-containing histidine kinase [Deltaproteobacteria bacterium]